MIRKLKKSERAPLTSNKLFWTAFMAAFVLFIWHTGKTLWQIKVVAVAFAVANAAFFCSWIYFGKIAQKQRLLANRNGERIFGAWIMFALFVPLCLRLLKPQGTMAVAGTVGMSLLLACLLAFFFAKRETKLLVSEIEIETDKISRGRIRIVQISDLHAGLWCGLDCLKQTVAAVNAQKPDIIVCTGDMKDEQLGENCGEELTELSNLKATIGKFAVTGNHDWANISMAKEFIAQCGFELLDGRAVETEGLIIAGAADRDHFEKREWGLSRSELLVFAYEFIQKENFLILLRHRGIIEDGQRTHFDLQLSGYKNGMGVFGLLLRKLGIAWGKGKCKKIKGGGLLYRAHGAGYIGAPVRVFCKPEVAVIDLVKKENTSPEKTA